MSFPLWGPPEPVSEWVLLHLQTRAPSEVYRQVWESYMGKPDSGMERTTAILSSKIGFNLINLLLVSTMVVGAAYILSFPCQYLNKYACA